VNTSELVAKIAEEHSMSKTQAQTIIDSLLKSIMNAAANDEEISLAGFGKFKVKKTPEREGRNPTSGEKIKIAASRRLTYSPAKAVKELLNG
jgi:DNA-binding protein HU-beta